jgi:hypothetical protein
MKHNGNLQVAGRLSGSKLIVGDFVGTALTSGSYEFPRQVGIDGSTLRLSGNQAFWDSTLYTPLSITQDISAAIQSLSGAGGAINTINNVSPVNNNINLLGNVVGGQGIEIIPLSGGQIRIQFYTPITITSFNGGGTYEIGQTIPTTNLSWSLNKPETLQQIDQGIGILTNGIRNYSYLTPISSNTTFTLSVTDGTTNSNASTSLQFLSRRYWGASSSVAALSSANILALANSELASNRTRNTSTNCTGGNRVVMAYPTSFGLATVKDGNGFTFQDWVDQFGSPSVSPYIISITNLYGYTQNYYIYQTFNFYNGSSVVLNFS